jgi:DNA-binding transcriptional regulator GbsR (MarR family)
VSGDADAWQHEFVERMGALGDTTGLPPSFTLVFAWLIVCDPPQQSVEQLRARLGLSSGSISSATTTLIRLGLVERVSQPGQRRLAYRLRPRAWERLLQMRLDATRRICATADDALAHVPGPHERLREMRAVLAHFESTLTSLLDGEPDPSRPSR